MKLSALELERRRARAARLAAKRPPIAGVEVVKRTPMKPERQRELERLLQELLDKYGTPEEGRRS